MVRSASREQDRILGTLLRDARMRAGVRQSEVAERLNRPQSFVSKYESGERSLRFVEVWEICQALQLSVDSLASGFRIALLRSSRV